MLSLSTHRNGASWLVISRDLENAASIISRSIGCRVLPSGLTLHDELQLKREVLELDREYRSSPSYSSFYEPVLELMRELSCYLPMLRGRSDYLMLFKDELLDAEWGRRVSSAYEIFLYIANIRRMENGDVPLRGICVDFSERR